MLLCSYPSGVGKCAPASRQRQVWFIPLADERGVCRRDPLRTRAIPERRRGVFTTKGLYKSTFTLPYLTLVGNDKRNRGARLEERNGGHFRQNAQFPTLKINTLSYTSVGLYL